MLFSRLCSGACICCSWRPGGTTGKDLKIRSGCLTSSYLGSEEKVTIVDLDFIDMVQEGWRMGSAGIKENK
jgi:hypothetical protein